MKMLTTALTIALIASFPAIAAEGGDVKSGKALHDKSCINCHAAKFGADGSKIYTRADRKVNSRQQLDARVKACNNNVGAGWFPEDEAHVAAYLNATYYHVK